MTGARAVIVLGMSRTGTSATMRLLNLLGVDVGVPEQLLGPSERQNAKGFYENRKIMLLNDELLSRLGGTWAYPPALPAGWETPPELDDLRDQARAVLEENFAGAPLWGFKDPRICLTLPFWRELIGEATFVICHRNVLEVAGSLARRDDLSPSEAVAQWVRYCATAIVNTAGRPRMFVGYDELFTGRQSVLDHLAALVGDGPRARDPAFVAAVDEWLDRGLRHHVSELADVITDPEVPVGARTLQLALELAVAARDREPALRGLAPRGPISDVLDATARSLAGLGAIGRPLHRPASRAPGRPGLASVSEGGVPSLADFVVIGSPADVRELAERLRGHPRIALDRDAEPDERHGIIDPRFSTGDARAGADELAARVVAASPDVALVVLLREPIERAIAHHGELIRAGLERRGLERALREQLAPGALLAARQRPSPTNGYIVWGEYGRVLRAYAESIGRPRVLATWAADPQAVQQVLRFIGIGDSVTSPTLPPTLPPTGAAAAALPDELQAALAAHFAADAGSIEALAGVRVPWSDPPDPGPQITAPRRRPVAGPSTADRAGAAGVIEGELAAALERGRGFALIRLGAPEIVALTAADSAVDGAVDLDGWRPLGRAPTTRELRTAIQGADAVGLWVPGAASPLAPAVRRLQAELQGAGRILCPLDIPYPLLGFDPASGRAAERSPLRDLLRGRPIAVVGPAARAAQLSARAIGLDVSLAIDEPLATDELLIALASARDGFDAVLVEADGIAPELCSRLATELEVVALDVGRALRRLLYPRNLGPSEFDARWAGELYLRACAQPPPAEPHPHEGRLVRERGTAAVSYIERGRARWVTHKSILALIGGGVIELEPGELASIPAGMRVSLVHDGRTGIYVLLDGRKLALNLGMPVVALDADLLDGLALDERRLGWSPGTPG